METLLIGMKALLQQNLSLKVIYCTEEVPVMMDTHLSSVLWLLSAFKNKVVNFQEFLLS